MPAGIGNEMNDLTRTLIVLAVSKVQIYWPQHFSVTAIAVYKTEDPAGGGKKVKILRHFCFRSGFECWSASPIFYCIYKSLDSRRLF